MIKFFRKIRYSLIERDNTSKYLKYAIGEIILVVIGILIALSINNWNENRKTNTQLNGYLNSIRKNIQSDTTEISQIIHRRQSHNQAAKDYMKCMLLDSMSLQLIPKITPIFGEQYLYVNQSGFEALKSSGYIAYLQGSSLEDSIFEYYALYEEINERETSMNNFIENMEVGLYDYDFKDISRFFKMNPAQSSKEEIKQTLDLVYHNSKILGTMQRVADEHHFWIYDSLRAKGQKVVELIEKRISND